MKTNFFYVFLILILTINSCDKTDSSNEIGKVVFYTNAQGMLNCGSFNVDIYIDNDSVGSIHEPYVDDIQPECINSSTAILIEKKTGRHNYNAKMDCGQYGSWSGEITIISDSCTFIFLDIANCNPKND